MGMDVIGGNAGIEIAAGALGNMSYIDFTYIGQDEAFGRIITNYATIAHMAFRTGAATRMNLNQFGLQIGTITTIDNGYRLYVSGSAYVHGNFSVSGSKNFDIKHPTKDGYRLRHRCLEGPEAYLFYQYQETCTLGLNTFNLPEYFEAMNKDVLVYVSPYKHFWSAWGETSTDGTNKLYITTSRAGIYNIQVVGTRNDQAATDEFETYGVEYEEN